MSTPNRKQFGNDRRKIDCSQSIRERLYRQYNAAIEHDVPIDPTLETLLFGYGEEDDPYYELPLLRRVDPRANTHAEGRGAALGVGLAPVDSMGATNHEMAELFTGTCKRHGDVA
jgi:hypothetical protein